jgi:methionine-rich copper-binding protein CopC
MLGMNYSLGVAALSGALSLSNPCIAMQMVGSFPSARTVIQDKNAQYVVRFDTVVDHHASRLEITKQGRVIRTLQPLLRSDTKALTASASRLPPGAYELHWSARSVTGESNEGTIPFTVAP